MLNAALRPWLIGGWFAALSVAAALGAALGVNPSTSVFLFALSVTPAVIIVLRGGAASSPAVAGILQPVAVKDGRR